MELQTAEAVEPTEPTEPKKITVFFFNNYL